MDRSRLLLRITRVALLGASCFAIGATAKAQQAIELDTVTIDAAEGVRGGNGSAQATPGDGAGGGLETNGYVAKSAAVGTKTDTELKKVPQTINVVSRQQLEDRNVQTLSEALTYTPGVRIGAFGFDPRFDSFYIRGFDVTYTGVYRDGLRELNGNFSIFKTEPYGLEGISILKGPSSVLYGGGSPGGIVNLVSKRPTEAPFREIVGEIGTNKRYQASFDASGPLGNSDNVLYRITGLARDAETDLASAPDDRTFIAPALTIRSDDRNTQLTVLGEYMDFTTGGNASYVNENGRITNFESGDPAFGDFDGEQGRIGYEFEHRFDDTFTVRQNLRYAHIDADVKYTQIDRLIRSENRAERSAWRITDDLNSFAVDNQAQANFSTGPVKHTLLGGLDYTYVDVSDKIGFGPAPDLDLSRRNYGEQPIGAPNGYALADGITQQGQVGLYAQDQLEYNRFVLTLGGRYDWLTTKNFNFIGASSQEQDNEKFSGRVGLNYLFDNGISPYVSYSTSFAPEIGRGFDGSTFKPTEGEQEEIGIKYAPDDLNLTINAALFRIRQTNVRTPDPLNAGFQLQRGEVESKGFELEATTSLAAGLNLTAAYTYLDLEVIGGDSDGAFPSGIPSNQFSVWSDYTVQSGAAAGLGFGGGLRYVGESWTDDTNTDRNDDRIFVDAKLSYDFGKADPKLDGIFAQVNARNLFDKRGDTCQAAYCYRDEGRSVIGTVRYRF
ncbi:TonB-dependent siderophore receptor [Aureimonas psammosilenae]|uniref:TonB-dependent siderophore receptor n=1 Tax=Aureimonas psammosilenae TaxID=2495496 RepID=UPI0012610C98|nr:TonB-dependent siderophore receptor [Aureimonas psammosilenae]